MPRKVQPGYTEYEIIEADKLLTKFEGDRTKAAEAMGMPVTRLRNMIRLTSLQGKWGHADVGGGGKTPLKRIPQGAAAEITRLERTKPVGDGGILQCHSLAEVATKDLAVVEAINREDRQIAKTGGLARLGANDKEQEFLAKLEKSYTGSVRSMMDLTFAGMGHAFTRTLFLYEDILRKIEEIDANPGAFFEMGEKGPYSTAHDKRVEYLKLANDYVNQLRQLNRGAEKANEMRLQLQKLEKENIGDGIRAQPGFKPQVAKVEQHVHYHGEQKPKKGAK